jgi:hypothetical protein
MDNGQINSEDVELIKSRKRYVADGRHAFKYFNDN